MALLIPAIEINPIEFAGDTTSGSATISNIADTSQLSADMRVYGPGIPYGAVILSKTSDSITLDQNATATAAGVSLEALTRFSFVYPPVLDDGEQLESDQVITDALSGIRQTVVNYFELKRRLRFNFLTKSEKDELLDVFLKPWILLGNEFRYFEDKDVNEYLTYTNDAQRVSIQRTVKKHPDYLYQIELNFRRKE